MEKLPISLCILVHNSGENLRKVVEKHRPFVKEVIVLDQGSTDNTGKIAEEVADLVLKRRHKGYCEPDREYLFSCAKEPYILNLDDDEFLSDAAIENLPSVLKSDGDIFWFHRKNLVDGVDISPIMGNDPQPRLWKQGALRWGDKIHVYPEAPVNAKIFFLDVEIIHDRTLEGLKKANIARNRFVDDEMTKKQLLFIGAVEDFLSKKREEVEQDV